MATMLEWLSRHWLPVIIIAGLVAASIYVFVNRSSLFYKD